MPPILFVVYYKKGDDFMATSSITKNFVISGKKQVEMFADAIEESANDQTSMEKVDATFLTDSKDIAEFMNKRNRSNE